MKKKLAVWRLIKDSLNASVPVMLLYVLESNGSSPGRQGFFMAVTDRGRLEGSIGGGIMEHKLVEKAKKKLQEAGAGHQETKDEAQGGEMLKQVHDKSAAKNQSGMICSGEQTVWLYPVQQKEAVVIDQIMACLTRLQNATLQLSPQGLFFLDEPCNPAFSFQKAGERWLYRERLGYVNHLYVVGGGHCSLALSGLMRTLDFYVHVFDTREGLSTMEKNNAAHRKEKLNDYGELSSLIPEGQNSYVVIMTFGYRTDDAAVRALLRKNFRYIGLLGSKAKIARLFKTYLDEGIEETAWQRFHAPIGAAIKSETPEEIAVSIAAEIIAVKARPAPAGFS